MKLAKDVEAVDLGIYLPAHKTLVLSDFHIGYEEALNKQGVFIPRLHLKDILSRIEKIFAVLDKSKKKVEMVVLTGDVKHTFGSIGRQEWRDITRLIEVLHKHSAKIVLIKGNHDVQLGPIVSRKGIVMVPEHRVGDFLIIHGDTLPVNLAGVATIIMGHEHPAVTLRSKNRAEKYKCYLVTSYKRKRLIVQPSFNLLTEGTDVLKEQLLSPLLKTGFLGNLLSSKVFIVDDRLHEVLSFGSLKSLK